MGFFFLPVDSPVVYKQAKKKPTTQYKALSNAHNKKTAGRRKIWFSSHFFLATIILDIVSVLPIQLQEKTRFASAPSGSDKSSDTMT